MGGLVLALASAAAFGTADFLGGLATRRASALLVTLAAHLAGAAVVLPVVLLLGTPPDPASLAWGAASGICGCAGAVVFFRALAGGAMASAAPVTAIVSAALPVLAGVLLGERPAVLAWVGVAAGLLAVGAISRGGSTTTRPDRQTLVLAAAAGVGFGLFFICLSRAPHGSGLWPLLGARMGSLTLLGAVIPIVRVSLRAAPVTYGVGVVSGAVDMIANALFLLATREGELALVAVLASLYPAATVVLALAFLRERLHPMQLAGVALALLAVALIASG